MLANHGRWLAKSLAKGSASDRPRQTSFLVFSTRLPFGGGYVTFKLEEGHYVTHVLRKKAFTRAAGKNTFKSN